jgi:hypothetical protein
VFGKIWIQKTNSSIFLNNFSLIFLNLLGLHGPRGRSGKPGTNGIPGIPGVGVFKAKSNGSDVILIPPSIAGKTFSSIFFNEYFFILVWFLPVGDTLKPIIISEGKHLRLRCGATGQPKPHIQWRRDDGRPIVVGGFLGTHLLRINVFCLTKLHFI